MCSEQVGNDGCLVHIYIYIYICGGDRRGLFGKFNVFLLFLGHHCVPYRASYSSLRLGLPHGQDFCISSRVPWNLTTGTPSLESLHWNSLNGTSLLDSRPPISLQSLIKAIRKSLPKAPGPPASHFLTIPY